jgi:hypothetical protein
MAVERERENKARRTSHTIPRHSTARRSQRSDTRLTGLGGGGNKKLRQQTKGNIQCKGSAAKEGDSSGHWKPKSFDSIENPGRCSVTVRGANGSTRKHNQQNPNKTKTGAGNIVALSIRTSQNQTRRSHEAIQGRARELDRAGEQT